MLQNTACEKNWGLINDYADGRLKGARLRALQAHLTSCARCQESAAELSRLRGLAADQEGPSSPVGFWERCMQVVLATPRPRRFLAPRLWKPALGLALAVALLLVWLPSPWRPWALTSAGRLRAPTEISDAEYIMQHVGFATGEPLDGTSHYVLLSARAAEEDVDRTRAGGPGGADLSDDADITGDW